ncbi:Sec63 Brl domain-containing protein [Blyttiomyces helicus]|uniref:Sec63 Brl domain-containing protein n=1 Tax=Blyttiomyces helicus TaxID=388810 RepID=A0A4V1IQF4_9FUNG|nr:Sec63 Brl domain-containing protein [Blyttiomyces helicus]|eukprot:RKO86367.1 Sec63 Brl domain-containing protein [Blyttiomyces helicus]
MLSMNKPAYSAIMTHSPKKPVIIFVSSRRQTRLTAQDLISLCALDDNPKKFLHMPEGDLDSLASQVKDAALKLSLTFGIGLHHAGLVESDRKLSEELFVNGKIQVLVATSTLAWGVNFPAHLVVVKGTEFYDAPTKKYQDFPITDVLQMMGRAGRPQFDDSGVAVILVHDVKKNYYKKFLHEPFPVESSLHKMLHDHINAEIVGGTIKSKQDAVDYLTWTYLYRRLQRNPTYYGVQGTSEEEVSRHMSQMVEETVNDLVENGCVYVENDFYIETTVFGRIASYYYLRYTSMGVITKNLGSGYRPRGNPEAGERAEGDFGQLLRILADVGEYDEHPVRHNEDNYNREVESNVPLPINNPFDDGPPVAFGPDPRGWHGYDDPHAKTFLLLQAHLVRLKTMPCADFFTDTISVLDQSIRVMQAMVDVAAEQGFLTTSLGIMIMMQCIKQAVWPTDSPLLTLPHVTQSMLPRLSHRNRPIDTLAKLAELPARDAADAVARLPLSPPHRAEVVRVIGNLPVMRVTWRIEGRLDASELVDGRWCVDSADECEIKVDISRLRPHRGGGRVHAPAFPKPQTEGWWLVLGRPDADELVAMRRIASSAGGGRGAAGGDGRISSALKFLAPEQPGVYSYLLQLVSDAYVGLDQQVGLTVVVR